MVSIISDFALSTFATSNMKSVLKIHLFCIYASFAFAAHVNLENGNGNHNKKKIGNDPMESLGEAFDALVRTTKIAIDHHLEKVEAKITDTVERKTDNFDTKIRQIESEIE